MRLDRGHPGSTTLAEDERRTSAGVQAEKNLVKGLGANCLSADHLNGSDLCIDVINRNVANRGKAAIWFDGTNRGMGSSLAAAKNLAQGVGVHQNQGNHSGGNTCADVIAAVADNF